jgi:hypothetical protein
MIYHLYLQLRKKKGVFRHSTFMLKPMSHLSKIRI